MTKRNNHSETFCLCNFLRKDGPKPERLSVALLFDPDNARLHYNMACAMSRLGDADAAVDLIEPWIEKVSLGWLMWMQSDNSLDPIREHPRFAALMARGTQRLATEGATS